MGSQTVRVGRGESEPVDVIQIDGIGPAPAIGVCRLLGSERFGPGFTQVGAVQRFGVSPDGATLVFEATDEFSLIPFQLQPEQKGIFAVNADGTDLRRLGPPSRERVFIPPTTSGETGATSLIPLGFSPSGDSIVIWDTGPGPDGEAAPQITMIDLVTGARIQVTELPPAAFYPGPLFLDDDTIAFLSYGDPEGLNPDGKLTAFTVRTDGSQLHAVEPLVSVPPNQVIPLFAITGKAPAPVAMRSPTTDFWEVFLIDGENLLQLTNFAERGTATGVGVAGTHLSVDGRRIFFNASADPLNENPSRDCQIFSVDRSAGDLRQLTHFVEGVPSVNGCGSGRAPRGCLVRLMGQDVVTRSLVFYSSCDPFGSNPDGGQIFAARDDGTGLRQLTHTRGLVREEDGSTTVALPGPISFGAGQ